VDTSTCATCDDAVAPVAVDQRFQALITFTNNSLEFAGDRWHNKGSTNSKSYAAVSHQHAARRDPSFSNLRCGDGRCDEFPTVWRDRRIQRPIRSRHGHDRSRVGASTFRRVRAGSQGSRKFGTDRSGRRLNSTRIWVLARSARLPRFLRFDTAGNRPHGIGWEGKYSGSPSRPYTPRKTRCAALRGMLGIRAFRAGVGREGSHAESA